MPLIKYIARQFDLTYIKPGNLARAVQDMKLVTKPVLPREYARARQDERRCGIDRRQDRNSVLEDFRSPYPRRKSYCRRKNGSSIADTNTGIDVYV